MVLVDIVITNLQIRWLDPDRDITRKQYTNIEDEEITDQWLDDVLFRDLMSSIILDRYPLSDRV